jgi:hypothetical protein
LFFPAVFQSTLRLVDCCACFAAAGALQVKLLVEQGGARISALDRFGKTPLDEAQHANAADVLSYLSTVTVNGALRSS